MPIVKIAKIAKKLLPILLVLFLLAFGSSLALAGTLVTQYSGSLPLGDFDYYYSPGFYINTGTISVAGWQVTDPSGYSADNGYGIVTVTWYGHGRTNIPVQYVSGTYSQSNWFSPIHFTGASQNTEYAVQIWNDNNADLVGAKFGGDIYDGT